MCDFGTPLGQLSWVCADPSSSLPGDILAFSAAWASRAAPSRLPHLALFSSQPRVIALLTVQRRCSHPLPPTLHPSPGNATRAAPCPARGGVTAASPAHTSTASLCAGRAGSAPPRSWDGCCQFWGGDVGLFLSDTSLGLHRHSPHVAVWAPLLRFLALPLLAGSGVERCKWAGLLPVVTPRSRAGVNFVGSLSSIPSTLIQFSWLLTAPEH